jgi:AbrB family looped-hinge helix DNA binding protein
MYHLDGYFNGMKTTIDRAGRVVIPKEIRQRAGLTPGSELEIRLDNGIVEIMQAPPQGRVVERDGFLLWKASEPLNDNDVLEAIERDREDRIQEILRKTGLEDSTGH